MSLVQIKQTSVLEIVNKKDVSETFPFSRKYQTFLAVLNQTHKRIKLMFYPLQGKEHLSSIIAYC